MDEAGRHTWWASTSCIIKYPQKAWCNGLHMHICYSCGCGTTFPNWHTRIRLLSLHDTYFFNGWHKNPRLHPCSPGMSAYANYHQRLDHPCKLDKNALVGWVSSQDVVEARSGRAPISCSYLWGLVSYLSPLYVCLKHQKEDMSSDFVCGGLS